MTASRRPFSSMTRFASFANSSRSGMSCCASSPSRVSAITSLRCYFLTDAETSAMMNETIATTAEMTRALCHCFCRPSKSVVTHANAKRNVKTVIQLIRPSLRCRRRLAKGQASLRCGRTAAGSDGKVCGIAERGLDAGRARRGLRPCLARFELDRDAGLGYLELGAGLVRRRASPCGVAAAHRGGRLAGFPPRRPAATRVRTAPEDMKDMAIAARDREPEATEQPSEETSGPQGLPMIVCTQCGTRAEQLHLGCSLCEDCCDCRP